MHSRSDTGTAFLLPGFQNEGGDVYDSKNHGETVGKGQEACLQGVLQLHGRLLSFAGRRRAMSLCAAHFPIRDLLQLFPQSGITRRKGTL